MEPVLIYTNKSFVDRGAIQTFSMDLAFGADEQDFEIEFSKPSLSGGELLYIDGTEYGGIIDEITHSTETDNVIYKGRTWHGMLAGKIVKPPSGSNYYTLSGDANTCIRSLLTKVGLSTILTGRTASSGITVNYQFERFCNAYDGLLKMLASAGAVLRIERHDGITELWAEPRTLISDEADSDLMDFAITDSYRVPNHLVCAGEGELQDRVIVDLYADASGNVSQTQTYTGVNEIAVLYNYNNADRAELIAEGTKELQSYQLGGGADLQVNNKGDWHVGDLIRVRDNKSGTVITSTINKKIVKVSNGVLSVDYEVGVASAQSYGGGSTAESNLVTPIANGGTGATTAAGARANLNVVEASNASTMRPKITSLSSANQQWSVRATVTNNANTTYNGHETGILVNNDGIALYDWDDGTGATQWKLDAKTTTTTTVSSIITAESGITLSSSSYSVCGKVAMLSVAATGFAASTGSQTVGTVVSGKRPVQAAYGNGSSRYVTYTVINTSGVLTVYWNTAPSSDSTYTFRFMYLLP